MQSKVFLGGTVNGSRWREKLIPNLKIDYFNPVVKDWDQKAYQRELSEREQCNYCLYVLTPKMNGYYSIAEVIDDSNKRPNRTLLCILPKEGEESFSPFQLKSLQRISEMVKANGGRVFNSLHQVATYLNEKSKSPWLNGMRNIWPSLGYNK
ncbi:MAG: hypothetical protein CMO01_23340 [Thalassobius sp.]|nr:hypothetical protein [Thalassovita sp.]